MAGYGIDTVSRISNFEMLIFNFLDQFKDRLWRNYSKNEHHTEIR